jgi:uncharacterized membrane protein YkvI
MFAVAMMIVSTVIGAGFATGAELVAFFGASGMPPSLVGVMVGVSLFVMLMGIVKICEKRLFSSTGNGGKLVMFSLNFIFLIAMTAGIRALGGGITAALAAGIAVIIVSFGFNSLLWINKWLIGGAIIVLLFVSVWSGGFKYMMDGEIVSVGRGVYMSLFYAGMNCCMLGVILARAQEKYSGKQMLGACALASVIMGLLAALILAAVRGNDATAAVMPVLMISSHVIVVVAIYSEILTSMYASLFSATQLLHRKEKPSMTLIIVIATAAWLLSAFGFTTMVSVVYPIVGVVAVIVISSSLLWIFLRMLWHQILLICLRRQLRRL